MRKLPFLLVFIVSAFANVQLYAQELNAKVNVNYSQIENTKTDIFPKLQCAAEAWSATTHGDRCPNLSTNGN